MGGNQLIAGWGFPGNAKKAHFFPKGELISLCGKWMFTGYRTPPGSKSPDDCAACTRALSKETNSGR